MHIIAKNRSFVNMIINFSLLNTKKWIREERRNFKIYTELLNSTTSTTKKSKFKNFIKGKLNVDK